MKFGCLRQTVLLREEGVPGVPLLARIAAGERDVEAALEQFDLGLGLVVPVTTPPRPRVAFRALFRNHHDAAPLSLHLIRSGLGCLDAQLLVVEEKIVTVEAVPGSLLAGKRLGRVRCRGLLRWDTECNGTDDERDDRTPHGNPPSDDRFLYPRTPCRHCYLMALTVIGG